jgi:hypothetical protein
MPTPRSGIPGWLWGIAVGAIGALVVVGVVMRSSVTDPKPVAEPEPVAVIAEPVSAPQAVPQEVTIAPQPNEAPPSRDEELEKLRQQVDELRRRNTPVQSEPVQAATPEPAPQQEPVQEQQVTTRQSALEQSAQAEEGWRPTYSEFQKRYNEKKAEFDKMLGTLKQIQGQCNYTHMGEPTDAEKRRGAKQEGLPASLVMGGSVGYGSSCDTVDADVKNAERDKFEALRDIQDECYKEAMARGVSTAKAKLR